MTMKKANTEWGKKAKMMRERQARLESFRKPRTCLKCGRTFDSSHPTNRICKQCTRKPRNAECKMVGLDTHMPRVVPLDPQMKATLRGMNRAAS